MDYVRYLKSNESIDDRALNCQGSEAFENYVSSASHDCEDADTLQVLEVGAGVGSMFLRLYQRGSRVSGFQSVNYTLVDVKDELLQAASERIRSISTLEQITAEVYEGAMQSRLASISGDRSIHYAGSGRKPPVVFDVIEVSKDFKVTLVLSDVFRSLDEKVLLKNKGVLKILKYLSGTVDEK